MCRQRRRSSARDFVEAVDHVGELVGRPDVEAGGEHVAGVEAEADAASAARTARPARSQLLERPPERVARAGGVLEQERTALRLVERVLHSISPTRGNASSCGSPLVEPGWSTTPSAPISSPSRSAWISESADFFLISRVLGGRIDEVDRVDHDRLDRPVRHELAEGRHVVGLPAGRAPRARRLAEDLYRLAAALDRPLVRLHQPACRGNMGADEHAGPLRTQPDGRPPHRRREDGTVQLAARARLGREPRAPHRGHRPRALHAGERRA